MQNSKRKLIDPESGLYRYCNDILEKFLNGEISYDEFYCRSSIGWYRREKQLKIGKDNGN